MQKVQVIPRVTVFDRPTGAPGEFILTQEQIQLSRRPAGADGTLCVQMYVPDIKLSVYLNMEPGEIHYTGYGRARGSDIEGKQNGIAYRAHLFRNAGGPRVCVLQVQDDPKAYEYKILMVCTDERGLPVKNSVNETQRFPYLVFDTAQECAEYEEYLVKTYEPENRPTYTIRSWQEDTPIETKFSLQKQELSLVDDANPSIFAGL